MTINLIGLNYWQIVSTDGAVITNTHDLSNLTTKLVYSVMNQSLEEKEAIRELAYALWEKVKHVNESAEEIWSTAEEQFRFRSNSARVSLRDLGCAGHWANSIALPLKATVHFLSYA